jgi:peptidoglycan/xylan/chitin deacetylase (PgdA/CDA1 family)
VILYPELVALIKGEGHVLANHSMFHENGWRTNNDSYIDSVLKSIPLTSSQFRPPYGKLSPFQYIQLKQHVQIIMWSWMSYDFDARVPINTILKSASESIQSGDILVFHENYKSAERLKLILPSILTLLEKKGLRSDVL